MDINFYKITNNTIAQTKQDIEHEDWQLKCDWIDIRTDNRKEVSDYFKKRNKYKNILDCTEQPEAYPFSNTFGSAIALNLPISNATDIYKLDHVTVILDNKIIITITPQSSDLFNQRTISAYSDKKYPVLSNFILQILAVKILAKSNANMGTARARVQGIERLLATDQDKISSNDVMSCERDINQLSDIIEDQYVGFEMLVSFSSSNQSLVKVEQMRNTIKGFEPLDKAVLRLEKKAESLRLQFLLLQQEKSTRKINFLTIIQAVFVPLTFIAGVYGMNFLNMPELNWKYAYFVIWGIFVGLASGLLIYFYRKGWFD